MLGFKVGFVLTILLIGALNIHSQEVISSAGNYNESSAGSINWVLGEVIQSNLITLSAEEESKTAKTSSSVAVNNINIECAIYPNPFVDYISVSIKNNDGKTYKLDIYSIQGKLVFTKFLNQESTCISLKELEIGNYLAQIYSDNNNQETFQIIKSE